jgi:hypothetical protein
MDDCVRLIRQRMLQLAHWHSRFFCDIKGYAKNGELPLWKLVIPVKGGIHGTDYLIWRMKL